MNLARITRHLPESLLSTRARIAIAVIAAVIVSITWLYARSASQEAARFMVASLSRNVQHVTLPTVQIIASASQLR